MGKLLDKIRGLRKPARPFCTTVVVAAGQSRRMGKDKLLLPLGEGTVLEHTLRAVDASERTDEIILVTREDLLVPLAELCKGCALQKPVKVIRGGETRTESVMAGALEADPRAELESAGVTGASAPAVPVTDTIKVADENGIVRSTPERRTLFAVQTPQVFQAELLKAALQSALTCGAEITDDCSAVERLGKQVQLGRGDSENIKITRPMDLPMAEAILRAREGRA